MSKSINRQKIKGKHAVSVLLAAVNGFNSATPVALPFIVAAVGTSPNQGMLEKSVLCTSLQTGGQLLDKLFFVTAYAASVPAIDGQTIGTGDEQLVNWASVSGTIINGGLQQIHLGATVMDTTIYSGTQAIFDGTATDTTIYSGGSQITTKGIMKKTTINGGSQLVDGPSSRAENTTINNGGVQEVTISATATYTTINSGGTQKVVHQGNATSTTIKGGTQIVSSGNVTSTTIYSGIQNVFGGNVTDTTINGGTQTIYNGASVTSTTVNFGGMQQVNSGGSATSTTVSSGGILQLYSGGSATSATLNAGYVLQADTGATLITSDGTAIISGGQVNNMTLDSGDSLSVLANNSATSATVNSGGLLHVCTSGTADTTTINSGGELQLEKQAGITGTTTVNSGTVSLLGTSGNYSIDSLVSSNGTINLSYGLTADRNLTINSLSGSANFIINTDLKNGISDYITIKNTTGSSHNTVQVKYDPGYLTGQTIAGTAAFATVPGSLTTFTAVSTDYGAYTYTPTVSVSTDDKTWTITKLTASGASETVYTASDILGGNLALWRSENNTLAKRMGELRDGQGQAGDWLRIYRGKQEMNAQNGRSSTQQYIAVQGGYDTKHVTADGSWHTGYTVGYFTADTDLTRGSGEASSLTVGAYGT